MRPCCDGDPKLTPTLTGATIEFVNGQPTMDDGLENAVYLSLFGGSDYWANSIEDDAGKYTRSFEEIYRRPLSNAVRLDAIAIAEDALSWMVTSGAAKSVEIDASIPAVGIMLLTVIITEQDATVTNYRWQINWQTMRARAL